MKEIVISQNCRDKKYRIMSFDVTKIDFQAHEDVIKEFINKNSSYAAFHYLACNDYSEKVIVEWLFDGMEIIGYECFGNIEFPEFYNVKTMED